MADNENEIKDELNAQNLSVSQMLQEINNAIIAASQAQQYRIGSRSVQRADINSLKKLRYDLMNELALEQNNNRLFANTSVCEFEGR